MFFLILVRGCCCGVGLIGEFHGCGRVRAGMATELRQELESVGCHSGVTTERARKGSDTHEGWLTTELYFTADRTLIRRADGKVVRRYLYIGLREAEP